MDKISNNIAFFQKDSILCSQFDVVLIVPEPVMCIMIRDNSSVNNLLLLRKLNLCNIKFWF